MRSLKAYFILYVIEIKWIMCVQKKTELCSMSQRSKWSSIKISGDLSFATKKKQQNRLQTHFLRGGKTLAPSYPGVAFATPCHLMATGLKYRRLAFVHTETTSLKGERDRERRKGTDYRPLLLMAA